jgi:hypothetical protein
MAIATKDDFVYVAQGDFDEAEPPDSYSTWFKVDKNLYMSAWQKTIANCKAVFK